MSTLEPDPTLSAEQLERLGDEAYAQGDDESALGHWTEAECLYLGQRVPDDEFDDFRLRHLEPVIDKLRELFHRRREAELRTDLAGAIESGNTLIAAESANRLGEVLDLVGDPEGAETSYRQAVAFSRQLGDEDPELTLWTFSSLIGNLKSSAEAVELARELAANILNREAMYHPMRAAEAASQWAATELEFARTSPGRVDHAIDDVARQAIDLNHDVCFHAVVQDLQHLVADVLRTVGRDEEAAHWQADADEYEDWEEFSNQQIPGHVHLWDIRIST